MAKNPIYKTRVETSNYVCAHGKEPRGRGSYAEAKRSALNDVAGRLPVIWVCS